MRALGDLEAAVMEEIWRAGHPVSVRTVYEHLARDRDIAYTTVLTVMERLWRKKILVRRMEGKAHLYRASRSRPQIAAGLMREVLRWGRDAEGVLVRFVDELRPSEVAELRRLLAARARRRQR